MTICSATITGPPRGQNEGDLAIGSAYISVAAAPSRGATVVMRPSVDRDPVSHSMAIMILDGNKIRIYEGLRPHIDCDDARS